MAVRTFIVAALLACVAPMAPAQGIPVFDAASIIKAVEQLEAWNKQYSQMLEQITTAKSHLQQITGTRNLGAIIDNIGTEATVPTDIIQQWKTLSKQEDLVRKALTATNNALTATTDRGNQIRALMQSINATTDPKAIAEMQARMSAEVALVNNDMQRVQLMKMQGESQQQRIEADLRDVDSNNRKKPLASW